MTTGKRTLVGILAVAILVSLVAAPISPVAAQDGNETSTTTTAGTPTATTVAENNTTTTPTTTEEPGGLDESEVQKRIAEVRSGPYSMSELKRTGTVPKNTEQESLRSIGTPPNGFISMRYRNPTIFDEITGSEGQWAEIGNGGMVRQNTIQAYGSAFGPAADEYTLEIVYWQRGTTEIGNTTYPYAANQTIDRVTIDMQSDTLYTQRNVSLRSHFDETWQVTMLLKQGDEEVDGAIWTFTHRSNPSAAAIDIDSAGGAWAFALRNAVIPGAASVIVGLVLAMLTLKRIGRGPGYGVSTWVISIGIIGVIISLIAYYQIAVILQNLPWVMGLSMGAIAYAAGLTFHDDAKRIGFWRRELVDAATIPGDRTKITRAIADGSGQVFKEDAGAEIFDELTEALYADLPDVPAVRTEEGYRIPVTGVKAAAARLFADAALLDVTNIATRMKVRKGRLDDIIVVDPDSDPALEHKPARIVRTLPIDTLPDEHTLGEEVTAYIFTALILAGPPAGGMWALGSMLNLPIVGFLVGAFASIVLAHSAEDGWIDFEAAPPHYKKAEDNLTMLQRAYKTSKEDLTGQQQAREERAKTAKEAREDAQEERRTVTDKMLESLGTDATGGVDAGKFVFEHDSDDEEDGDDEQ